MVHDQMVRLQHLKSLFQSKNLWFYLNELWDFHQVMSVHIHVVDDVLDLEMMMILDHAR